MKKEQKVVVGLGMALVATVGILGVYIPFYSAQGIEAQSRAGLNTNSQVNNEEDKNKRSASMWKNIERNRRQ